MGAIQKRVAETAMAFVKRITSVKPEEDKAKC